MTSLGFVPATFRLVAVPQPTTLPHAPHAWIMTVSFMHGVKPEIDSIIPSSTKVHAATKDLFKVTMQLFSSRLMSIEDAINSTDINP
jgi:hypothetical protein